MMDNTIEEDDQIAKYEDERKKALKALRHMILLFEKYDIAVCCDNTLGVWIGDIHIPQDEQYIHVGTLRECITKNERGRVTT